MELKYPIQKSMVTSTSEHGQSSPHNDVITYLKFVMEREQRENREQEEENKKKQKQNRGS